MREACEREQQEQRLAIELRNQENNERRVPGLRTANVAYRPTLLHIE
jgi:hypothetical protein